MPKGQITSTELANTFVIVLQRMKIRQPDIVSVEVKETSVKEMSVFLQKELLRRKQISFFACCQKMKNLSDVIGLFLALLELCKKQEIRVTQKRMFGDLDLERVGSNDK